VKGVREQMSLAEMCLRLAQGNVNKASRLISFYADNPSAAFKVAEEHKWDLFYKGSK